MSKSRGGEGGDTPRDGHYGEAVFRPEQAGEDDRIDLGALTYDDATLTRLTKLGAGPGWHCLDLGAGTGTVARRLLSQGGVAAVLAVDRDVRYLSARPTPGLTALEADITAPDFGPGQFQLVHARFVLMHLRSWQRMVTKLSTLVAPGGVLVLGDAIDLTTATAPTTPYTQVMRAMWQGLKDTIGTDVSWVPDYPQLLRAAGLESVAAEIHVPPLLPGSPISRFWAGTWDRARESIVATRLADEAAVDAAIRYLDSPDCAALSPGMITAWGWKPEEASP
ncbi:class I SAM-dependent methyltransferase [Streptomyces lunaelactis]|uniref:class I SAM-dependent methyltransferase n=1 Tax=Streptomyces lunaelactis TaxID=1535768 RepID=UPI001584A2FA|nr:class I SAM-dependent methyltransferase [Streptomyces lunaelactis]NUK06500.1 class I SAM-dependent methyltransferase [Streptomyces lunaelactis]NUK23168.1 class I SAM-dependent methyltransferase [Streptomyces lunaelactis]NUK38893.1 class I SAM-dependent methyltransferase [Streptomyces lunaelactis]NUK40639.1 class I SAM-dependent methyltransferase [Streptomyces lunaelactis]NUK72937.1 class I SAM-dependent methyltransferase [Streptomyces lunaelactis]